MNSNTQEIEIDLLEIFFLLKRRILIIILSIVVAGGAVGLYSNYFIDPVYESTARLYILTQSTSLTSLADIQVGTSLTQDYKELIKSRTVVEQVIENMGLSRSYSSVLKQLTITNPSNTRIIVITVQDTDPELARVMADEFVDVSKQYISDIMVTKEPSVVEYGNSPMKPVSPNVMKNTLIGALLGLFLSVAVIVIIYMMDDTIKTTDDIEKYLGLNTLASVPLRQGEQKSKRKRIFSAIGGK